MQPCPGTHDVADVVGHERPIVHLGGRGQQPVDDGNRIGDVEPAPFLGHLRGDRDDAVGVGAQQTREPLIKDRRLRPVTPLQPADSLSDLSDGKHTEIQLPGVNPESNQAAIPVSGARLHSSARTLASSRKLTVRRRSGPSGQARRAGRSPERRGPALT